MGICIWNNDVFNHHIRVSIMIKNGIKKEKLSHKNLIFLLKIITNLNKNVKLGGAIHE